VVEWRSCCWKCERESESTRAQAFSSLRRLDPPSYARATKKPLPWISLYIARFCLISLPCLYVRTALLWQTCLNSTAERGTCKHSSSFVSGHPHPQHALLAGVRVLVVVSHRNHRC
jgi:hypothetical protein